MHRHRRSLHARHRILAGRDALSRHRFERENIADTDPAFRAAVNTVKPDGTLAQFATGIRNPVGIAFYPGSNQVWVSVNERDGLGDGLVPDYFTHLDQGAFLWRWPWAYIGGKIPIRFLGQKPS